MYYTTSYTPSRTPLTKEYYPRPVYSPYQNFNSSVRPSSIQSQVTYQQKSYYPQQQSEIESIVNKYRNKQTDALTQSNRLYSPPQKEKTYQVPEFKPQEFKPQEFKATRRPIFSDTYQHQPSEIQLQSYVEPQKNPYLSDDDSAKLENFQDLRSSDLEFKEFSNQLPTPLAFQEPGRQPKDETDHQINKFVDSVILQKVHKTMDKPAVKTHVQKIDKIAENDEHVKLAILGICGFIFLYMIIEILR